MIIHLLSAHYSPSSIKLLKFCNVHEQLNPYDEQQSEVTVIYIIWLSPYNKDVLSIQSTGTGPSQIIAVQAFC